MNTNAALNSFKGKSTIDHVFTLRQLIEKHYEYNKPLHLLFIDFKQAYDSIKRKPLWKSMDKFGIPSKLVKTQKGENMH